jgi:ABC-type transporter Mla subunit MlaD
MFEYLFDNLNLDATVENLKTTAGEIDTRASALANGLEGASNVVDALSGII